MAQFSQVRVCYHGVASVDYTNVPIELKAFQHTEGAFRYKNQNDFGSLILYYRKPYYQLHWNSAPKKHNHSRSSIYQSRQELSICSIYIGNFMISGHMEACGGYTWNLKVVCYVSNFLVPEFIILRFESAKWKLAHEKPRCPGIFRKPRQSKP